MCNCCSCCCGAIQAQRNGTPMLASSGFVCQVDVNKCIGCGDCNDFCQFGVLTLGESTSLVNIAQCMGCGVWFSKCQRGALSLARVVEKGEPLEIRELFAAMSASLG